MHRVVQKLFATTVFWIKSGKLHTSVNIIVQSLMRTIAKKTVEMNLCQRSRYSNRTQGVWAGFSVKYEMQLQPSQNNSAVNLYVKPK